MQSILPAAPHLEELEEFKGSFARHETFHPRYGWLKKGFDLASEYPNLFLREDATVLLGVGKNMVRAIRYWCLAFKVLEEVPNPDRPRVRNVRPTLFGKRLLGESGWDPYLEDPATLWFLHWQLLSPPSMAPSWWAAFNTFRAVEFTPHDLIAELLRFRDTRGDWHAIVDRSLKKDADCILRMYSTTPGGRFSEDSLDSPFMELDLIRRSVGGGSFYSINLGPKASLPDELIAYAAMSFAYVRATGARTMSLSRLALEPGGPGKAFKLPESSIREAVERVTQATDGIVLLQTAGTVRVAFDDPTTLAAELMGRLYGRKGGNG